MNSKQRRKHNRKMKAQTERKTKPKSKVEEIILHNYQSNYLAPVGSKSGWYNSDISLPSYVPRSLITKDYKDRPDLYISYLEMPDQVMEFGDETQKGLVKCITLCQKDCDKLQFECKGYKYKLDELRAYNQGLRGLK